MLSEEIKTLQGIFLDNGYPGHLVQRIVQVAQVTDSTEDRHESTTDPAHLSSCDFHGLVATAQNSQGKYGREYEQAS